MFCSLSEPSGLFDAWLGVSSSVCELDRGPAFGKHDPFFLCPDSHSNRPLWLHISISIESWNGWSWLRALKQWSGSLYHVIILFNIWYSTLHYLNPKSYIILHGSSHQWSHCDVISLEGSFADGYWWVSWSWWQVLKNWWYGSIVLRHWQQQVGTVWWPWGCHSSESLMWGHIGASLPLSYSAKLLTAHVLFFLDTKIYFEMTFLTFIYLYGYINILFI